MQLAQLGTLQLREIQVGSLGRGRELGCPRGNAVCDRMASSWAGRSCSSSRPVEIQGSQQLLPFPSPGGTFHLRAAPEDSSLLTPQNSSFCGTRLIWKQTQRKAWSGSRVFPEQKICFYFQCDNPVVISVCGAPSPRVGAERENHHLAKEKNTKKSRRRWC